MALVVTPVATFEFILVLIVAVLLLEILAKRTGLPPAAALIVGGVGLAFVPHLPIFSLDPDLVLVLFLPPLLIHGAYFTSWSEFRRELAGILSLAVGAVAFTTVVVGLVAAWLAPHLPWAACFALGAIVSPPDAVAAKAVLERVALPRRLLALLDGESLLDDAAGLVLFKFAVAAALTGSFSVGGALATFGLVAFGGLAVGGAIGFAWVRLLRLLRDPTLTIATSFLLPWAAYIGGEAIHVSGVIATVTSGLILGWHQHEIFTADVRLRGTATWRVMVFLMEALVFILIGLSLRGVIARFGGTEEALGSLWLSVSGTVAAVILSRFAWTFGTDSLLRIFGRWTSRPVRPLSPASNAVLGWAGMRGVVTLAIALSLPAEVPGRDLILASAFGVILVTVLIQGTTLGLLVGLLKPSEAEHEGERVLTSALAHARVAKVQFAAIEAVAVENDGTMKHPRLLEQYAHRAAMAEQFGDHPEAHSADRAEHHKALRAAIAAGRREVLRLHRSGQIHDQTLNALEQNLDFQEMMASMVKL